MGGEEDGMRLVRALLCERLVEIRADEGRAPDRFCEDVAGLRRLAAVYGLTPVVRIAGALERSVAEGGPRGLYLSRLEDAIGCGAGDEAAAEALLASVSVRLG
jgi:hypothetical protein